MLHGAILPPLRRFCLFAGGPRLRRIRYRAIGYVRVNAVNHSNKLALAQTIRQTAHSKS